MKEFDIFVPLTFNDGSPIPAKLFQKLQARLLNRFDGLTFFPQPNRGFWKLGDVTYKDEIVIYRVLSSERAKARRFLVGLKKWLKLRFDQEEILVIERDVEVLP